MTVLLRVCLLQFKFPPKSKNRLAACPRVRRIVQKIKNFKNSDVDGEHPRGGEGKQLLTTPEAVLVRVADSSRVSLCLKRF